MKRTLLSMCALCAVVLLASCGSSEVAAPVETGNTNTPVTEEASTETEAVQYPDPVGDVDFGGAEVQILTSASITQHTVTTYNELSGDVLDDAMYARTKAIEEKLNIKFLDDYVAPDVDSARSTMVKMISAGDSTYDICQMLGRYAFTLTNMGYFTDVRELPYVTLTTPWWESEVNETVNLTEHLYITYGSANLGLYDMLHVLCFNKELQSSHDLENPYDLVLAGTWTFDKMAEMAKAVIQDADGDGTLGTKGDIFGFVGGKNTIVVDFIAGAGIRMVDVDAEKNVTINLLSNPKIEEIYTKVTDTFWSDGFWYSKSESSNNYYLTDTYFQDNQALFADHTFYTVGKLRDMVADFGIVPFPKWDESQSGYGTLSEAGVRITTVPTTAKNPALVGALLEELHYLSYINVRPAYYEVTLKTKYTRDSVSAQMLDIITDSILYDLGDTMLNDTVKDGIFKDMFNANKRDYVSYVTKKIKPIEKAIEKAQEGKG